MQKSQISQLAEQSGYSYTHVSRVLNGKNDPSLTCARALASLMGMTLDQFVARIESKQSPIQLWPMESA